MIIPCILSKGSKSRFPVTWSKQQQQQSRHETRRITRTGYPGMHVHIPGGLTHPFRTAIPFMGTNQPNSTWYVVCPKNGAAVLNVFFRPHNKKDRNEEQAGALYIYVYITVQQDDLRPKNKFGFNFIIYLPSDNVQGVRICFPILDHSLYI